MQLQRGSAYPFNAALIEELYQPGTSPEQVFQIQDSLQKLQRSDQGWQMADALLGSQDENVRFFGASTFTIKLNSDWNSLREDETGPILHRLLEWLISRLKSNERAKVIKKLCAALVAYFLRSPASWARCLLHLICSMSEGKPVNYVDMMSVHYQYATQKVKILDQSQLRTALWFATTLVEEVGKTDSESIRTSGDYANCWKTWVLFAHGAWNDKANQVASLRTLIPFIAQPLWNHDLFEVAADCWTEILGTCPTFFPPEAMVQLRTYLTSPNAQDLLSLIVKGQYEDEALAYSRLLLAYGDVMLQDLARQPDNPSGQVLMHSLMQLLAYEGFAGADDDICTPAMEFWQAYTEFLIDSIYSAENQAEPWMDSARHYVMQIIEQCWIKIHMPPEEVYAQWTPEARGDFQVFRKDVVDLLQSAYTLLGISMFDRFAQLTLESLHKRAWLQLEATLSCLNALAESISDDDTADVTLSPVFDSGLFHAMTDNALHVPSNTQQTTINLITSFTPFFERHPQFLQPMLNFLFIALRTPALTEVAAKAVLSICDACRNNLVPDVDTFLEQYDKLLGEDIESRNKERLVGAIAAVIQAVPFEDQKIERFSKLLAFVERDVSACLKFAKNQAPAGAEEKGLCALRCLVSIGKYVQQPDDQTIDLESKPISQDELYAPTIWTPSQYCMVQIMNTVSGALGTNHGDVAEAICQIFRSGFKEDFPGPFVFAPSVIEDYVVTTNLQSPRPEQVFGMAGASLFAHMRNGATKLEISATRFLNHLFHLAAAMERKSFLSRKPAGHPKFGIGVPADGSTDNPTNEPEMASSCIDLALKYIPHYLHIFLNSQYRNHVVNFLLMTIRSMQSQEIMPRKSAASFWAAMFVRYDVNADVQVVQHSLQMQYGPQVTQCIINNIGGDAARSELENWTAPLRQIVTTQVNSRQWISSALFHNTFPSAKVSDVQKRQFVDQVIHLTVLGRKLTAVKVKGLVEDEPDN
ncbi:MAG: hypothetical protein Q9213_005300 [Squamulea squamosa]